MTADARVVARIQGLLADTDWQRALLPMLYRLQSGASVPAIQAPRLMFQALGGDSPWIDELCAALGLFYAYLDLADDVEDGELPEGWANAAIAQNAADGLMFRSLKLAGDIDREAGLGGRLWRAFVDAGCHLTWGQDRDLKNQDTNPEAVLATIEAKTGRSLQLYVVTAALLAEAEDRTLDAVATFGLCWGVVTQLVGDWWDIWRKPYSPDLANRRHTYPIAWALASDRGDRIRLQMATPLEEPLGQLAMRFRLESTGADQALWQAVAHYREKAIAALQQGGIDAPELVAGVDLHPPAPPPL